MTLADICLAIEEKEAECSCSTCAMHDELN